MELAPLLVISKFNGTVFLEVERTAAGRAKLARQRSSAPRADILAGGVAGYLYKLCLV